MHRPPTDRTLGEPRLSSTSPVVRHLRWLSGRVVGAVVGTRRRKVVVHGVRLRVEPGVFDPVLFRSGVLLAGVVKRRVRAGERVLEVGTGSGASAILAATKGAQVLAVDINPAAVECARDNAARAGVGERVEVRLGDVFEGVQGRFDRVICNPPFYLGDPRSDLDHAWRGRGVLDRLADGLADVLSPQGEALLLLSTEGACSKLLERLVRDGWATELLAEDRRLTEHLAVYGVRR